MRAPLLLLLLALPAAADVFPAGSPRTTDNDDTCDIALLPAATLLLPYFEVDLSRATGETTVFTVTNVTSLPQVARVTLWTDYAYPVLGFNLFLTGYDVQSINLFDVIGAGRIASETGPAGRLSEPDNPLGDERSCAGLPLQLPVPLLARMQQAFTTGKAPGLGNLAACNSAGGAHANAVGYATVDLVGYCTTSLPTDDAYFRDAIRYDNVLIGDYQQLAGERRAYGAPMVHIRAMPEGQLPAERSGARFRTNLPQTFYDRYLPAGAPSDARQPLPSLFAARWAAGAQLTVWREAETTATTVCSAYPVRGGAMEVTEFVLFDEEENPETLAPMIVVPPAYPLPILPATSRTRIDNEALYPPMPTAGAAGGWLYMNLDRANAAGNPPATQNWVVVTTAAGAAFDAAVLGNGCTPETDVTNAMRGSGNAPIQPAPAHGTRAGVGAPESTANDDTCDIAVMPAATLLLPYFEVDPAPAPRTTTTFTIANTTMFPQVARVTLWNGSAAPVVTFNVFLTGYDVQRVDLHDVIAAGQLAPPHGTGFDLSHVGELSGFPNDQRVFDNPLLDEESCRDLPSALPPAALARLRQAFSAGGNAAGYATIDVVGACTSATPLDRAYFHELRYDNVLIGDYEHREAEQTRANPMVHIRALPEGGLPELRSASVNLPRTFYGRYLPNGAPSDARQPLPATFAARWSFDTTYEIWREAASGAAEIVRFDEAENPEAITGPASFPAASRIAIADTTRFPENTTGAVGGWMYLNLGDSQNWIVVSMSADGGAYGTSFDAAALGNGCTPAATGHIGPAENFNPRR